MPDLTDAELLTLMRDADRIYGPHSEWYRALDELEALRAEQAKKVISSKPLILRERKPLRPQRRIK